MPPGRKAKVCCKVCFDTEKHLKDCVETYQNFENRHCKVCHASSKLSKENRYYKTNAKGQPIIPRSITSMFNKPKSSSISNPSPSKHVRLDTNKPGRPQDKPFSAKQAKKKQKPKLTNAQAILQNSFYTSIFLELCTYPQLIRLKHVSKSFCKHFSYSPKHFLTLKSLLKRKCVQNAETKNEDMHTKFV